MDKGGAVFGIKEAMFFQTQTTPLSFRMQLNINTCICGARTLKGFFHNLKLVHKCSVPPGCCCPGHVTTAASDQICSPSSPKSWHFLHQASSGL
ncbi:hypothetical protein GDO78_016675 [Eleutherodactylus coqui]|uniref:Uncharacterized protein n=1 Tax=Eleutherodactylus coqui TaxID=57060 RepID=A0A8J6B9B7_ELECQ|nr:hypothetical protein GDO78_016675 [Eleutherodactylus coqui]